MARIPPPPAGWAGLSAWQPAASKAPAARQPTVTWRQRRFNSLVITEPSFVVIRISNDFQKNRLARAAERRSGEKTSPAHFRCADIGPPKPCRLESNGYG